MNLDYDQLTLTQQALVHGDPDGRWLRLLETFLPVGLADMHQLQAATGFSRDQVNRLLEKFRRAAADGPAILSRYAGHLPRPWRTTRGAHIYLLAETGAGLLRFAGHETARPCGLKEPTAILHALAVLEVRLAAQAASLSVTTEQELVNTAGQALRPDNLVQLPAGPALCFEVEQAARPDTLRRIADGLRRRLRFFAAPTNRPVSPTVRLLFALPRNAAYERTLRFWQRVVAALAEEQGRALPCRFVARPLGEFLAEPDWGEPPAADRWHDLSDPALLTGRAPAVGHGTEDAAPGSPPVAPASPPATPASSVDASEPAQVTAATAPLPAELARYAGRESHLILRALWQHFLDSAAGRPDDTAAPDPVFFETMTLIYLASHDPTLPAATRASLPRASWFLLEHYLKLHPALRAALNQELGRPAKMVWNASTIRFRLQTIAGLFLAYHGLRTDDDAPLFVCAEAADLDVRTTRPFAFYVHIREPALLADGNGLPPTERQIVLAERALAWVLHTIALAGDRIGLRPASFR